MSKQAAMAKGMAGLMLSEQMPGCLETRPDLDDLPRRPWQAAMRKSMAFQVPPKQEPGCPRPRLQPAESPGCPWQAAMDKGSAGLLQCK